MNFKTMKNQFKKEKDLERALRLIWSSLASHLEYCYGPVPKLDKQRGEGHKFHKDCVKEYAEVIKILSIFL